MCMACVVWGAISGGTGAVQTYEQLLAVRILLGAAVSDICAHTAASERR